MRRLPSPPGGPQRRRPPAHARRGLHGGLSAGADGGAGPCARDLSARLGRVRRDEHFLRRPPSRACGVRAARVHPGRRRELAADGLPAESSHGRPVAGLQPAEGRDHGVPLRPRQRQRPHLVVLHDRQPVPLRLLDGRRPGHAVQPHPRRRAVHRDALQQCVHRELRTQGGGHGPGGLHRHGQSAHVLRILLERPEQRAAQHGVEVQDVRLPRLAFRRADPRVGAGAPRRGRRGDALRHGGGRGPRAAGHGRVPRGARPAGHGGGRDGGGRPRPAADGRGLRAGARRARRRRRPRARGRRGLHGRLRGERRARHGGRDGDGRRRPCGTLLPRRAVHGPASAARRLRAPRVHPGRREDAPAHGLDGPSPARTASTRRSSSPGRTSTRASGARAERARRRTPSRCFSSPRARSAGISEKTVRARGPSRRGPAFTSASATRCARETATWSSGTACAPDSRGTGPWRRQVVR